MAFKFNDDEEEMRASTMVIFKDIDKSIDSKSEISIFPPINHENLHTSFSSFSSSSSPSTSSFSPSDSDLSESDPEETPIGNTVSDWRWWIRIGVEALRVKLALRGNRVAWLKASAIFVAAMVWSSWLRGRYRRRLEDLASVLKAKDERINKLLLQIAEMNQLLIVRHTTLLASKLSN